MTWPGWGDVLPLLAMVGGVVGSVLGAAWTLAPMGDRIVSRAGKKASGGEAAKTTEALYERFKANDFKHVEAKIDSGLKDVSERMGRMEATVRADRRDMWVRLGPAAGPDGGPDHGGDPGMATLKDRTFP